MNYKLIDFTIPLVPPLRSHRLEYSAYLHYTKLSLCPIQFPAKSFRNTQFLYTDLTEKKFTYHGT